MASIAIKTASIANGLATTRAMGQSATQGMKPSKVQSTKNTIIKTQSIVSAFIPFNPMTIPFQVAMFVIFVLIFAFAFGLSWKWSAISAWVLQGIITYYAYSKFLEVGYSIIFGV